jgi:FAD/FMN-containing dehydrogenase/Fe-S oxidoreductase
MRLPVLERDQRQSPTDDWAARLTTRIRGQVRFGNHDRLLYSTDASIYQVMPIGVIVPADEDDALEAIRACSELQLPLLPRGGGTSLAGQCTNRAVVLDLSPRLRKISLLSPASRTVQAQSGATLGEVNRYLFSMQTGLFFAPDPATQAQATVGGCIGNNAAGARSIKYGRTSENVATVDVALSTAARLTLCAGAGRGNASARSLALKVGAIVRKNADLIRHRYPKTIRRNAGYNLDLILQQLDAGVLDEDLDLSGLVCGSEGTLAVVISATLKLHPVPAARGLAVIPFDSVESAIERVPDIAATKPSAIEMLDEVVLEAAAGNIECSKYLSLLPRTADRLPRAVLYVEYEAASSRHELQTFFDRLSGLLGPSVGMVCHTESGPISDLWELRKAAEPLLHRIDGGPDDHRKPNTFVEDNAVPVERLGEFVSRFKKIIRQHRTTAAFYAHASVGLLHVRPLVDLHNSADRDTMRSIAAEVADLARECGGVMSGEHGDGRLRGPLLERFYGKELMSAFREVKAAFDPANLLNPGNIVEPGPVQGISENLRIDRLRLYENLNSIQTYFDYSDQHGFGPAAEMCNGAGVCRKTSGGTMCPSYRATLDERHSTRGRGNALRVAITGQLSSAPDPEWADPDTIETLHLCLSCKACKSECPSNVDIARLKAEYAAQRYRVKGPSLQARVMGNVRRLNKIGSIAPASANWVTRLGPVRAVMNRVLGLDPRRSLPPFAPRLRKWFEARQRHRKPAAGPRVVLFEDCFTGYNEPHIAQKAIKVLESFGYEVLLPRVNCCGRAMISTGLLPGAIASADAAASALLKQIEDERISAILFLEPSCLSAVKDDWLQLKLQTPLHLRKRLSEKSMLVEEFLDQFWESHPRPARPTVGISDVLLHGHCHQKALWGDSACAASLRRIARSVMVLPSGCCGMAGSFGFSADRYDLSMKIGELSLFPSVRAAAANTIISAPGTSCRHQIRDGTGRHAMHPMELWSQAIGLPNDEGESQIADRSGPQSRSSED